ncbi:MAG TPA: amidohydrolase family protein [Burkholderiaceae bacterium]|nr:amidohydrolase family protein [Burkholderiaceae bacterium]
MSEPNLTVRADPTGSVASVASVASADPAGVVEAASVATGWDCHVHVFDAAAPVRPGHYRPDHHPLEEIEALALAHGIGHLVLVQPSVYGSDNTVMLRALQAAGGRHRGIAVVEPTVSDAELDHMHALGVRGVRFNLVSPAGHRGDVEADLRQLAPRLRERGWQVQWYVRPGDLPRLLRWQAATGLCFVLDHLAGLDATLPPTDPAWATARALAEGGAWIKLSGWYRLAATEPYDALQPQLQHAVELFGPRCVWGSDWPHTSFAADQRPRYASMLAPAAQALDTPVLDALLQQQAQALYL